MARRNSSRKDNAVDSFRGELAQELAEKERKILEFKKKMDERLERLAMDVAQRRKAIT